MHIFIIKKRHRHVSLPRNIITGDGRIQCYIDEAYITLLMSPDRPDWTLPVSVCAAVGSR